MIKKNKVCMPPIVAGALPGITRDTVAEIALKSGLSVEEKFFSRMEMFVADEVFLTGTGAEIVPVIKIDGRVIGDGKPGRLTKDLVKNFRAKVASEGTPIE
jgi:branched-chain amino acid aminotransferase